MVIMTSPVFSQEEKKEVSPYSKPPVLKLSGALIIMGNFAFAQDGSGGDDWARATLAVLIDTHWGNFGLHADVRFQANELLPQNDLRKYFVGYEEVAYLNEGYAYAKIPFGDTKFKIGLIYTPFGLAGPDSTYSQSLPYWAGVRMDADYGIVFDSTVKIAKPLKLNFAVGYYMQDDRKDGTVNFGSVDIGIENSTFLNSKLTNYPIFEEKNSVVARLNFMLDFGMVTFNVGGSFLWGVVDQQKSTSNSERLWFDVDFQFALHLGKLKNFITLDGLMAIVDNDSKEVWAPLLAAYSGQNQDADKKFTVYMLDFAMTPFMVDSKWFYALQVFFNYSYLDRKYREDITMIQAGAKFKFSPVFEIGLAYGVVIDESKALQFGSYTKVTEAFNVFAVYSFF